MREWFFEQAVELVAAIASVIAAVAAIWIILDNRRLADPKFGIRIGAVPGQPNWHEVFLSIVVPPDQRFLLKNLSVEAPQAALLLQLEEPRKADNHGEFALPKDKAATIINLYRWLGPVGHREPQAITLRGFFFFVEDPGGVDSVALKIVVQRQFPTQREYKVILRVSRVGAEPPTVWL